MASMIHVAQMVSVLFTSGHSSPHTNKLINPHLQIFPLIQNLCKGDEGINSAVI